MAFCARAVVIAAAGLILGAAASPATSTRNDAQNIKPPQAPARIGVLENGMRIAVQRSDVSLGNVRVALDLKVGSAVEDADQPEVAHILEHILHGSYTAADGKRYPFAELLDAWNVEFGRGSNATVSQARIKFFVEAPAEHLPQILRIFRDRASGYVISDSEIESQKKLVAAERASTGKMFSFMLNAIYRDIGPVALQRQANSDSIGSIRSLSNDAIRRYYRDWFRADLLEIFIVGDVDTDLAYAQASSLFSTIPKMAQRRQIKSNPAPSFDVYIVRSPYERTAKLTSWFGEDARRLSGAAKARGLAARHVASILFRKAFLKRSRRYSYPLANVVLQPDMLDGAVNWWPAPERRGLGLWLEGPADHLGEAVEESAEILRELSRTADNDRFTEAAAEVKAEAASRAAGTISLRNVEDDMRNRVDGASTPSTDDILAAIDFVTLPDVIEELRYFLSKSDMRFLIVGPLDMKQDGLDHGLLATAFNLAAPGRSTMPLEQSGEGGPLTSSGFPFGSVRRGNVTAGDIFAGRNSVGQIMFDADGTNFQMVIRNPHGLRPLVPMMGQRTFGAAQIVERSGLLGQNIYDFSQRMASLGLEARTSFDLKSSQIEIAGEVKSISHALDFARDIADRPKYYSGALDEYRGGYSDLRVPNVSSLFDLAILFGDWSYLRLGKKREEVQDRDLAMLWDLQFGCPDQLEFQATVDGVASEKLETLLRQAFSVRPSDVCTVGTTWSAGHLVPNTYDMHDGEIAEVELRLLFAKGQIASNVVPGLNKVLSNRIVNRIREQEFVAYSASVNLNKNDVLGRDQLAITFSCVMAECSRGISAAWDELDKVGRAGLSAEEMTDIAGSKYRQQGTKMSKFLSIVNKSGDGRGVMDVHGVISEALKNLSRGQRYELIY